MTADGEQAEKENATWVVGILGHEDEFVVCAATFETYSATAAAATTYHTPGDDFLVTVLLDADGKVVFCAPAASVAYIRRADITSRRVHLSDPAPTVHVSAAGGDFSTAQVNRIAEQVQAALLQQAKRSRRPGSAA